MAITLVGFASVEGTTSSSYTLTLPGGVQEGDFVIVSTARRDNSDVDMTITSPSGYTELFDLFGSDNQSVNMGVFYKFQTSTLDTVITFPKSSDANTRATAIAYVFRGVDPNSPFDVTPLSAAGGNQGQPLCPNIANQTPGSVIVLFGAGSYYSSPSAYQPAGFLNKIKVDIGGSYLGTHISTWKKLDGIASIIPGIWFNWVGDMYSAYCSCSIVLRSASPEYNVLWSPVNLDPWLWFDANDDSTITVDTGVSQWKSKTSLGDGASFNLVQATAGLQPAVITSGCNGKKTVRFDGVDDIMSTGANFQMNGTDPTLTVFVVHKKLTVTKGSTFGWGNTNTTYSGFGFYDDNSTVSWAINGSNFTVPAIANSTWMISSSTKSPGYMSTTLTAYQNGTSVGSGLNNTPNVSGSYPFTLGRWGNWATSLFHGDIAEVLVFPTVLSTAMRQKVEGYLAWKWGLVGYLPNSHPYKLTPPGMSLYTPAEASAALWLDASDSTSITIATGVSEWRDKSGNDRHASQATTTNQPALTNGKVVFDGTNDFLTLGTVLGKPSSYSIFAVSKITKALSNNQSILASSDSSGNSVSAWGSISNHSSQQGSLDWMHSDGTNYRTGFAGSAFVLNTTSINCVICTSGVQDETVYKDGTVLTNFGATGTGTNNSGTAYQMSIGKLGGYAGWYFGGEIAEVLIFTTAISETDRQKVEGYLAWKWGLVTELPSGHPYKLSPPVSSLWNPSLIISSLWLDAADFSSITLATGVSEWRDKSGNGRNPANSTGSTQPVLIPNSLNGKNITRFDGTDDSLTFPNSTATDYALKFSTVSFALFAVVKPSSLAAATNIFFGARGYDIGWLAGFGTDDPYFRMYNASEQWQPAPMSAITATATDQIFVATAPRGTTGKYRKNGLLLQSTTSNVGSSTMSNALQVRLGSYVDGSNNTVGPFNGDIAELILIEGVVSDNIIYYIEGYLAWKWDLVTELPTGHPYKTEPPLYSETPSSTFVESSLQLIYEYTQFIKQNSVNILYDYSQYITSIFNIIYKNYICSELLIKLDNATEIQKDMLIRYVYSKNVSKSIALRWVYAINALSSLNIKYDTYAEVLKELNIKYKISAGEVQSFLNFVYNNYNHNLASNALKMIWHSFYADSISYTPNVSLLIDDKPIPFNKLSVSASKSKFIILGEASTDFNTYSQIKNEQSVIATVSSDVFNLIVSDKFIRTLSNSSEEYIIILSSPAIKLLTPYSKPVNGQVGPGLSSAICKNLALSEGITLNWYHIDKYFNENLIYADNESKIDVIRKIVVKMGGKVLSKKDGTLEVTPKYSEPVSNWINAIPKRIFTNADFESISEYTSERGNYNRVFVSSQLSSSISYTSTIRTEEINSYTKLVKGFVIPLNSVNNVNLLTSGGDWVTIEKNNLVSETIEEDIEFVSGAARTQNPIYDIISSEWLQAFLGNITFSEDGNLEAPSNGSTKGCSYVRLKYVTKYYKWIVRSNNIESVQFMLDVERK